MANKPDKTSIKDKLNKMKAAVGITSDKVENKAGVQPNIVGNVDKGTNVNGDMIKSSVGSVGRKADVDRKSEIKKLLESPMEANDRKSLNSEYEKLGGDSKKIVTITPKKKTLVFIP